MSRAFSWTEVFCGLVWSIWSSLSGLVFWSIYSGLSGLVYLFWFIWPGFSGLVWGLHCPLTTLSLALTFLALEHYLRRQNTAGIQRWNLGAVVSCRQAGGVMPRACPFCTHHATSWGHFCPDCAYRKNPEQHLFINFFLCCGVLLAFLFQLVLLIQSACISTLSPFSTRLTPFASLGRSVLHSSRTFASSRSRPPL